MIKPELEKPVEQYSEAEVTKMIIDCQSFDELEGYIWTLGVVQGSHSPYSAVQIMEGIQRIKDGGRINNVTRTFGIRAKVAELLHYRDA